MLTYPASQTLWGQAATGASTSVQDFQHVEDSWSIAYVNKDQYGMDNLLAPAFVGISADGTVRTHNQFISDMLAGLPNPVLSLEQKVVNVRVVSDVAVVEGTYILHLRDEATQRTRDERGIFTHVFQRQRNMWSCISAQQTMVVNEVDGGKHRAAASTASTGEKKSKADLPFHIPLLHKGNDSANPQPENQTTQPPQ